MALNPDPVTAERLAASQAVENVVDGDLAVPTDEKGRPLPEALSDRVLLIEIATNLRLLTDAISALGSNPMLAAFMPPTLKGGR